MLWENVTVKVKLVRKRCKLKLSNGSTTLMLKHIYLKKQIKKFNVLVK